MTELAPRPVATRGTGDLYPRIDRIADLPILMLSPHSRCNCRCVMCDIWRREGRESLTAADLDAVAVALRGFGVRRVVLSGGEPLMSPNLEALGRMLNDAGVGVTLLSTGLLLGRHAVMLARFCDDVVVSLDGPEAVHDAIRNVEGAYRRLAEGVRALRATGADIRVTARCTVQRANARFVVDTVDPARDLGLDGISFLAVDVASSAFNRPDGVRGDQVDAVAPDPETLDALDRQITALAARPDDGFVAESPGKLRERLVQYFRALAGEGPLPPVRCNAPWVSAVLEADGTLRPCYFHEPFGNIREGGDLAAVLNGPDAVAWRRQLDPETNPVCRRCVCSLALRQPAGS